MKLKSFKIIGLILSLTLIFPIASEEKIDLWNKKNTQKIEDKKEEKIKAEEKTKNLNLIQNTIKKETKIESNLLDSTNEIKIFGIFDPAKFNFSLDMWSNTKAEDVRASIKRLKRIKLSKTSNEILENILFSFSYPPLGMSEKEFIKLRIDWLIDNNRSDLIENFLKVQQ